MEGGEVGVGEVGDVGVHHGAAAGVAPLPGHPGQHLLPGRRVLVDPRVRATVLRGVEDEHLGDTWSQDSSLVLPEYSS